MSGGGGRERERKAMYLAHPRRTATHLGSAAALDFESRTKLSSFLHLVDASSHPRAAGHEVVISISDEHLRRIASPSDAVTSDLKDHHPRCTCRATAATAGRIAARSLARRVKRFIAISSTIDVPTIRRSLSRQRRGCSITI